MEKKSGNLTRFLNSTVILYLVLWGLQALPNRTEWD